MGLSLTDEKYGVLHLGSRNQDVSYELNGRTLNRLEVVKDLGVRFFARMNLRMNVVPILLYGSQIWHPSTLRDIEILEKIQARFTRRIDNRCNLERGTFKLPSVRDRLRNADLLQLGSMMKNEEFFATMFDQRYSTTLRGFSLETRAPAKSNRVANLYPWRIE